MQLTNYRINLALMLFCILMVLGCDEAAEKKAAHQPLMVVEKADADFIIAVNDIIDAEIAAGRLAMEKGADKRIKNFGRIMVKDYTKGLAKLKDLAAEKRIPLSDSLNTKTAAKIAGLKSKDGKEFDRAYIDYITADHKSSIELFEQAQKNGFDKDVKTTARKGILVFERHLEAILTIRDSMK